jgi:ABC-type glycerol-3-phosphate transport system substrate-binding protein
MPNRSRPRHQRRTRAAAAAATVLCVAGASCADDPIATLAGASDPCGTPDPAGDVQIELQWQGAWDEVAAPALIERWDDATPGVDIVVLPAVAPGVGHVLGDDPPALSRVDPAAIGSLVAAGAIRPLDACVTGPAVTGRVLPGAELLGVHDGVRYGVAGNLAPSVMLYDHAGLLAAGVAEDALPATWDELHELAGTLRSTGAFAAPVVRAVDPVALVGAELTDDVPDGVQAWSEMDQESLLLDVAPDDELLPVGDGRAAFEIADPGRLWAYGSALGEGQAPDADVRVAAVPGTRDAGVPVGGDVWVVSTSASEEEAAAAASLLAWLVAPPQQAALHPLTDLFPTSEAAAAHAITVEYWSRLPLLAEVWAVTADASVAAPSWTTVPGVVLGVGTTTRPGLRDEDLAAAWSELNDAVDAFAALDPLEALECAYPDHAPPAPVTACASVP